MEGEKKKKATRHCQKSVLVFKGDLHAVDEGE